MNPCDVVPEVGGSIKMKIQRSPAPKEDCHGCKGPHIFSNLHISNFIIFRKFYDVFVFVPLFHLIDTKLSAYLQCTSQFGCQLQLLDAVLWHRRNEVLRCDHKKYPWFHAVPQTFITEAPDASVLINHVKPTARQFLHAIVGWNAKKTNNICPKISSCTRIQSLK